MKKLFLIFFFTIFLSSNLFADKKVDQALEKCADDRYINKTEISNFSTMLYLVQPKFNELKNEEKELRQKNNQNTKEFNEEYDKWLSQNPKPKMPSYSDNANKIYTMEQYNEKNEIWRKADYEAMIEIGKKVILPTSNRLKQIEIEIDIFIRQQASKFINETDFDLKSKAKTVNGYIDHYTICEKQYQETPSSFILKWGE